MIHVADIWFMRGTVFVLLIVLGTPLMLAQEPSNDEPAVKSKSELKEGEASNTNSAPAKDSDVGSRSSDAWKWILGIVFTAIISPIAVKLVEKRLGRDPIKDKSQRLKAAIDAQAARKTQGLHPDGRITALISELTDALGDEAKGKEQAIDEATSFIVGTLSSRVLEALFSSCRYIELLMDSKHESNTFAAILDLTRLEFLRSYYGQRRIGVPLQFTNISEVDLDQYAQECERLGGDLGKSAIRFAESLGSTPDDVRIFVGELKGVIQRAVERAAEEQGESSL